MDVVYNLIYVKNFSEYTHEEKLELKKRGRPMPVINIEARAVSRGREYKRSCNSTEVYPKYDWICGCNRKNAFFCFPCLLYGGERVWTEEGLIDVQHMSQTLKRHDNSRRHIKNMVNLALLGTAGLRNLLDSTTCNTDQQKNEDMIKHRYVLSKTVDAIKSCTAFDLSLRGLDDASTSRYPGMYIGLIDFSYILDAVVTEQLQNSPGISKDVQGDLLDCMLAVCREEMIKEINNAICLAIILDDITDVSEKQQLAVIFRYTRNNEPVERFWKFINPATLDVPSISEAILNELNPLIESHKFKLISQSYNGRPVFNQQFTGVHARIKEKYPSAYSVHYYAHNVNMLLSKVAYENTEIRVFFANLQEISALFAVSPQYLELLNTIIKRNKPNSSNINVRFNNNLIGVVCKNRDSFIECMEDIVGQNCHQTVCSTAYSIKLMLQDIIFIFWLTFFHEIVPCVKFLRRQMHDVNKAAPAINNFNLKIEKVSSSIDKIIDDAINMCKDSHEIRTRKFVDNKPEYKAAALKVCNDVCSAIRDRFANKEHLMAASLLPPTSVVYLENIPDEQLTRICSAYPMLDKDRLKTELSVLYSREDCGMFKGVLPLLKYLARDNMDGALKETRKLVDIVVTTPMITPESERCFKTLKRIRTFLGNTLQQERLTILCMLAVEKQFVSQIYNFNEKVVEKYFARKECKVPYESSESKR